MQTEAQDVQGPATVRDLSAGRRPDMTSVLYPSDRSWAWVIDAASFDRRAIGLFGLQGTSLEQNRQSSVPGIPDALTPVARRGQASTDFAWVTRREGEPIRSRHRSSVCLSIVQGLGEGKRKAGHYYIVDARQVPAEQTGIGRRWLLVSRQEIRADQPVSALMCVSSNRAEAWRVAAFPSPIN